MSMQIHFLACWYRLSRKDQYRNIQLVKAPSATVSKEGSSHPPSKSKLRAVTSHTPADETLFTMVSASIGFLFFVEQFLQVVPVCFSFLMHDYMICVHLHHAMKPYYSLPCPISLSAQTLACPVAHHQTVLISVMHCIFSAWHVTYSTLLVVLSLWNNVNRLQFLHSTLSMRTHGTVLHDVTV